jgi:hypothetical protein
MTPFEEVLPLLDRLLSQNFARLHVQIRGDDSRIPHLRINGVADDQDRAKGKLDFGGPADAAGACDVPNP